MQDVKANGLLARGMAWFMTRLGVGVSFLLWVCSGFGVLGQFGSKHYKTDEITLFNVNKAFFVWLPMVVGFILAPIVRHQHGTELAAWIFIGLNAYVMLCILFDISFLKLVLISLVVGFIWLLAKFLGSHNIMLFSHIANYITGIHPHLDAGLTLAWSWILLFIWLSSLILAFGYGRLTITSNGIIEHHIAEGNDILDRIGMRFRLRYYDLLELVLGFGSGTLEARSGNNIVKKYDSILFMFFWNRRLDELLNQRTTIIDNSAKDAAAVEDIHHVDALNVQPTHNLPKTGTPRSGTLGDTMT